MRASDRRLAQLRGVLPRGDKEFPGYVDYEFFCSSAASEPAAQ